MAIKSIYGDSVRNAIHKKLQTVGEISSNGGFAVYASDIEITKNIGNVSWKNSIYELATTLSFETAKTDNAYLKDLIYTPKLGEVIRIVTNIEVFRGIIITVDDVQYVIESTDHRLSNGWHFNKLELRKCI